MSKFTMPLRSLQSAMATVVPAIERKTTIPVLSTVRVRPLNDAIEFTTTNLELGITAKLRMNGVLESEAFLFPALKLQEYGKLQQGDEVVVSRADSHRATLRCGRSNSRMATLPAASYPKVEQAPESRDLALKQAVLSRLLSFVSFAIPQGETRFAVQGALLEIVDGKLYMVACDGHRLARYSVSSDAPALSALLPSGMVDALLKTLDEKSEGVCSLALTDATIFATISDQAGSVELAQRKLTARFPDYRRAMPTKTEAIVRINASSLVSAIKRTGSFADSRSGAVDFTVSKDGIRLFAANSESGDAEETVEAVSADSFEPFTLRFSASYVLDALTLLEGDIALRFAQNTGGTPMYIVDTPAPGETFEYVVMSMSR